MTKVLYNTKLNRFEVKDGRKVVTTVEAILTAEQAEGVIAGLDLSDPNIAETIAAAAAAAAAKRGSVIPDEYRYRYGADQSCGDKIAKKLTALVTTKDGVDEAKCREIAAKNGVEDRFDGWASKGLNPGMLRMNLGNVLRGMARRGEEVTL